MARVYSGKRPQNLKRTLGAVSRYLGRHRVLIALVAVLAALSASANLLGTYMIRPIVNQVVAQGSVSGLMAGVGITAAIYAVGVLSTLGYTQIMVRAAQKILLDIRRDLYHRLQTLPLRFFDQNRKGDLMSLFTNDVDTISDALNNSFAVVIQSMVQLFGMVLLLFLLNWRLSILVLAGYGVMFAYIRYSSRRSKFYFDRQQEHLGSLDGYIEEMTAGQKVVKVFSHEPANLSGFRARNQSLQEAGSRAQAYAATMIPAVVTISYFNYAIIAVLGGLMVLNGQSDLGSLASYLVFVRQSAMPINQLTQQGNFLLVALAGAERIFRTMEEEPEVDRGAVELVRVRREGDGTLTPCRESTGRWAWRDSARPSAPLVPLRGDVRFDHVTFGYEPGQTVLRDLSLYAKPGHKIAFVGSTGAGKTTITNLINRFYDIDEGKITIDDVDIRDIRRDNLRRNIAMVLQDTHLFTGTVRENIRYGRLDATDEEVEQAAKTASAHSFIMRLEKGYDTMIEGDGANLSQGQRQLLNIARAAISKAPILILDEATSSVDTRTEKHIEEGMDRLMADRTTLVIAHRLSTVRNADAILVLEHGEIMERGSHEQLLALKGRYYELYTGKRELE